MSNLKNGYFIAISKEREKESHEMHQRSLKNQTKDVAGM